MSDSDPDITLRDEAEGEGTAEASAIERIDGPDTGPSMPMDVGAALGPDTKDPELPDDLP